MRARHLLSKLLLRKGVVYGGGRAWTKRHREWLSRVELPDPCERLVLEEYLEGAHSLELRRARLDAAIAERTAVDDLAPDVSALCCLRGISTVTAFSIATEVGDFSRFPMARSFMSYLGLVPSESSVGETVARGRITRTGNGHVRTLLVESAWHHARAHSPMSATSLADARGVQASVAEAAERANRRLHDRSVRLRSRGRPVSLANAAVARELAASCGLSPRWPGSRPSPPRDAEMARGGPAGLLCAASRPRVILDTRTTPAGVSECVSQHAYVRLAVMRRNGHAHGWRGASHREAVPRRRLFGMGPLCPLTGESTYQKWNGPRALCQQH